MKIKAITKYLYNGKEYESLTAVKDSIHNTLGEEIIDKINRKIDIKHRDLFTLLDILCEPETRKTLLDCLNVTFEKYNEETEEDEKINVLDLHNKK